MKKRFGKWVTILFVLILVPAFFSGCKKKDEKRGDLSGITIGTCVMSLQHEFMVDLVTGYNEFQKQTNLHLLVTDGGNMEPEKQVTNVENFIAQKVDGILVQAISIDTLRDTMSAAADAGIPLGYYPHTEGIRASTYFNYNEYDWGYQLGIEASKWIKTRLGGKAKIINMESSLEPSAIERASGWRDAINKEIGAANVKWVMIEATNTEDAISNTESALQANPDVQMVLVYNDLLGAGAYQAVVQSGLNLTNMFVGSCDGTNSVLDLVELPNSVFRCTIGNDRFVPEIGFYWLQTIVRAALGMTFDNPFPITTVAISADNVKEYRARTPKYVLDPEIVEYMKTH